MSVFQKWKRRKWKGKRGSSSINPLEITLARGVGSCNNRMKSSNNGHFLFVYTSVIRNGFERSEHRSLIFGKQGPFCTLVFASWPRDTCTAACYLTGDGECATATVLKAEVDQRKQQFTVQVSPGSFKSSIDARAPKQLHQPDSDNAGIEMGRQVLRASYSSIFPESSHQYFLIQVAHFVYCLRNIFPLQGHKDILLYFLLEV